MPRPHFRARGYTPEWDKASKAFLAEPGNDRCCRCGAPSQVTDHRKAHKGDPGLFWARWNWQPMCRSCNSRKAASEEGGFGNGAKRRVAVDADGWPSV